MKNKQEIVENWLPRYTGVPLDQFGQHILLTNFAGYLHTFSHLTGAPVQGMDRPMASVTSDDITLINFGMGSPNAAIVMDLLSAVMPQAFDGLGKTLREQVGEGAFAAHSSAKSTVVQLTAAALANQAQYMGCPLRIVCRQPFFEQRCHFQW